MAVGNIKLQSDTGKVLEVDAPTGLSADKIIVPANINGDNTQTFKIADAVNADEAVSKAQMETAVAGAGKILNVWEYSSSTELTVNSVTFVDTEYTLTITPKSANSRFLVMYNVNMRMNSKVGLGCRFTRNGVEIEAGSYVDTYAGQVTNDMRQMSSKTVIDAPNTAGTITYTLQMASYTGGAIINESGAHSSNIIIFELGE